jgi:hypothetical protein
MPIELQTKTSLPRGIADALDHAVQVELKVANKLPPDAPLPKSLDAAYNAALDDAHRRAARALAGQPEIDGDALARFATNLASEVVATPFHASNMAVPLQLDKPLQLTAGERMQMATRMGVCPFVGSKIAQGELPIYGSKDNPLAKIEDIAAAGGAGSLGPHVLPIFAQGNHDMMLGPDGKLSVPCPEGFFSLHLLGSKGSHGANSGILHEPLNRSLGAGRRSPEDFDWLKGFANAHGKLDVKGMGRAIAERMAEYKDLDPSVMVSGAAVFEAIGLDGVRVVSGAASALVEALENKLRDLFGDGTPAKKEHRALVERLTTLTGQNTLVGSCGEWALLFAGWANAPGVRQRDGSIQLDFASIEPQFLKGKTPAEFDAAEKSAIDWAKTTAQITLHAFLEYRRLRNLGDDRAPDAPMEAP